MAAKAIRVGEAASPNETFTAADFELKHNEAEIAVDTNFAAQSFWKDALIRFFQKKSAVLGLVLIVFIVLLAVFGPGMNSYTYSGQDLSQKNFAPRVPGIEQFGVLDGSEKMSTTTGTRKRRNWTSTTGSAATSTAATSGPVRGRALAFPSSSPWPPPSSIWSSA